MAAVPAGLAIALKDRYRLDRVLGHGGMATVYLAEDLRHHRQVAIKVLRPEVAATLGPDRFLREITLTAQLIHPHILPLLDSGRTGGETDRQTEHFLFYVMPYVDGESLRDRLNRERQLPLDDALRIACEVADALGYAHSHQIIHRDIKPENILLQSGHAVVADFGIARAIAVAGSERLTETGIAVGTPTYMSPEQAAGESELDGRSDLYSLGCVLYEMLVGEPPFTGPTAAAIIARRLHQPVPSLRLVREGVPLGVERAVERALAKAAADRFATAADFAAILAKPMTGEIPAERRGQRRRWMAGVAFLVVLVAGLGVVLLARRSHKAPRHPDPLAIDSSVVAVLPFRLVSADTASTLRQLARGMPELFAMKITGEFGTRISHPPTVLKLWADAGGTLASPLDEAGELGVARTVGAGKLIRGTLVATDTSLVLTGELVAVPSGQVRVRPTSVEGRRDEWLTLVDRLAWQLLAQDLGIAADRLPRLARFKPRAIQAYLAGVQTRDLVKGNDYFRAALAADSTMVDAALAVYANGERDQDSAYARLAWEHQDELTPNHRAYLLPLAGWRFGATRTMAERIEQYRALVRAVPGSAGFWSELGMDLAQNGPVAGVQDWAEEARQALETCVRLDPRNAWAWSSLLELAFLQEDTVLISQRLEHFATTAQAGYLGPDEPVGPLITSYRWRLALLRGDSMEAAGFLAALSDSGKIPFMAAANERGLRTADRVAAAMGDRFLRTDFGTYSRWRGHFREWQRGVALGAPSQSLIVNAAWQVRDALFLGWPEDSAVAAQAAFLERVAEGRTSPAPTPAQRGPALCWSALWRVAHRDTTGARRAMRQLEREVGRPYNYAGCVGLITLSLTQARGGDVRSALLRLDSIVRDAPLPAAGFALPFPPPEEVGNLTLARLLVQYGDTAGALAASRRRIYLGGSSGIYESIPEFLREEGRMAALTGDRAGAIRAYTRYLALREDPDYAPWQAVRDSARRELEQLVGEPRH